MPMLFWLPMIILGGMLDAALEHDPEKSVPVFGKDHAPALDAACDMRGRSIEPALPGAEPHARG
jgi:hypothetical protein